MPRLLFPVFCPTQTHTEKLAEHETLGVGWVEIIIKPLYSYPIVFTLNNQLHTSIFLVNKFFQSGNRIT